MLFVLYTMGILLTVNDHTSIFSNLCRYFSSISVLIVVYSLQITCWMNTKLDFVVTKSSVKEDVLTYTNAEFVLLPIYGWRGR